MNILLVDDDDNIRGLFYELLIKNDHNVLHAEDGEIAFDMYRINKNWIDVVITDLEMGTLDLNGNTLIKNLREDGFDKPIKLVTGSSRIDNDILIGDTKYYAKDDFDSVLSSLDG